MAAFVNLSPDSPTLMFSTSLWMRIAFITFSLDSAILGERAKKVR